MEKYALWSYADGLHQLLISLTPQDPDYIMISMICTSLATNLSRAQYIQDTIELKQQRKQFVINLDALIEPKLNKGFFDLCISFCPILTYLLQSSSIATEASKIFQRPQVWHDQCQTLIESILNHHLQRHSTSALYSILEVELNYIHEHIIQLQHELDDFEALRHKAQRKLPDKRLEILQHIAELQEYLENVCSHLEILSERHQEKDPSLSA